MNFANPILNEPNQVSRYPMHQENHWEEIDAPLEDFGITTDIDEWLSACESQRIPGTGYFYLPRKQLLKHLNALDIQPTGFMLFPVCHHNGKVLKAVTRAQKDIHDSPYGEYYLYNFGKFKMLAPDSSKPVTSYRIRYATLQ